MRTDSAPGKTNNAAKYEIITPLETPSTDNIPISSKCAGSESGAYRSGANVQIATRKPDDPTGNSFIKYRSNQMPARIPKNNNMGACANAATNIIENAPHATLVRMRRSKSCGECNVPGVLSVMDVTGHIMNAEFPTKAINTIPTSMAMVARSVEPMRPGVGASSAIKTCHHEPRCKTRSAPGAMISVVVVAAGTIQL